MKNRNEDKQWFIHEGRVRMTSSTYKCATSPNCWLQIKLPMHEWTLGTQTMNLFLSSNTFLSHTKHIHSRPIAPNLNLSRINPNFQRPVLGEIRHEWHWGMIHFEENFPFLNLWDQSKGNCLQNTTVEQAQDRQSGYRRGPKQGNHQQSRH